MSHLHDMCIERRCNKQGRLFHHVLYQAWFSQKHVLSIYVNYLQDLNIFSLHIFWALKWPQNQFEFQKVEISSEIQIILSKMIHCFSSLTIGWYYTTIMAWFECNMTFMCMIKYIKVHYEFMNGNKFSEIDKINYTCCNCFIAWLSSLSI